MIDKLGRFFSAICIPLLLSTTAASADIGKVVDVRQGATLNAGGAEARIARGMGVDQGDVIVTGNRGLVQLLFDDGTKIAVGPKSRLVVDRVLMRGANRASTFAVSAVSGSFRFISGNSANNAYSVTTPTATMGVRGTAFDFHVASATTMVTLEGIVRMCAGGSCADGVEGCRPLISLAQGGIGTPGSVRGQTRAIARGFPFLFGQGALNSAFRVDTSACEETRPRNSGRLSAEPLDEDERNSGGNAAKRSAPSVQTEEEFTPEDDYTPGENYDPGDLNGDFPNSPYDPFDPFDDGCGGCEGAFG